MHIESTIYGVTDLMEAQVITVGGNNYLLWHSFPEDAISSGSTHIMDTEPFHIRSIGSPKFDRGTIYGPGWGPEYNSKIVSVPTRYIDGVHESLMDMHSTLLRFFDYGEEAWSVETELAVRVECVDLDVILFIRDNYVGFLPIAVGTDICLPFTFRSYRDNKYTLDCSSDPRIQSNGIVLPKDISDGLQQRKFDDQHTANKVFHAMYCLLNAYSY